MFSVEELKYIRDAFEYHDVWSEMGSKIIEKINDKLKQLEGYNLNLYSFHWDYGRQGTVSGVFKATEDDVKDIIGREVYFGEILGKYSEVEGIISDEDINLVSDDPLVVLGSDDIGYNPLKYVRYTCEECGDSYSIDEYDTKEDALKGTCTYCK